MKNKLYLLSGLLLLVCNLKSQAKIIVSSLIGDNMVVQRGVSTRIWGTADPREKIIIHFNGRRYQTRASKNGAWLVMLAPAKAGGPYVLSIKGRGEVLKVSNVLVGDVWVCSGQSNMEFTVSGVINADKELAAANDSNIRQFKVPKANSDMPASTLTGGQWKSSSPVTTGEFTAVGYFFAREMRKAHPDVPVGLINASWGGSRIEAWLSKAGFGWKGLADLQKYHADESTRRVNILKEKNDWKPTATDAGIANGRPLWVAADYDDSRWKEWSAPGWWWGDGLEFFGGVLWMRKSFDLPADVAASRVALFLGHFDDCARVWINGHLIDSANDRTGKMRRYLVPAKYLLSGKNAITLQVTNLDAAGGVYGEKESLKINADFFQLSLAGAWKYRIGDFVYRRESQPLTTPVGLYNAMISPLTNFTIGGVLWYQGEQNAPDVATAYKYRQQLQTLVKDWRGQFNTGDFPFVVVQLPNFNKPAQIPSPSNWAVLRESQFQVLDQPNTAVVNTIDLGDADDIHPRNKQDVGKRVALAVQKLVFKEKGLDLGPVYQSMQVIGDSIKITFNSTGKKLIAKDKYGYVTGFTIAGADKKFVWAKAKIEGNQVLVWSDGVKAPVSVRYGWANNPADAGLYSDKLMPAFTFRTDNWDPNLY